MDRTLTKGEFILGCILCFCLTFTVFLPRVVFHPYDLAEELSDALAGDMTSVLNQYLSGVGELVGLEGKIPDDNVVGLSEVICEKLREGFFGGKSCEITSADILRLDRTVLKEVIDEAFLELDREYKVQLSNIIDSENLSRVLYQSVKQELLLLKMALGLLYGLPMALAGAYAVVYFGKKKRGLAFCSTAGYIAAGFAVQLFWCLRIPGIVADVFYQQSEDFVENLAERLQESVERKFSQNSILEGLAGGVADGLIQEHFATPMLSMCRHMGEIFHAALKDSFGSGVWLYFVLLALLFGWVFWGMAGSAFARKPGGKQDMGAGISGENRYGGSAAFGRNEYVEGGGRERVSTGSYGTIRGGGERWEAAAGNRREFPGRNVCARADRLDTSGKRGMGVIRIMRGELAGASFQVSDGAPIIIGSHPAQANLIFSGVAACHCKIQFRQGVGTFIICSYVKGGAALPDGRFFPAGSPVQIPAGTQIVLGMPGNGRSGYTQWLWLG